MKLEYNVSKNCVYKTGKGTFRRWYERRLGHPLENDVTTLSQKDKEKLFLSWKHGYKEPSANYEIENTKLGILQTILPETWQNMNPDMKQYYKNEAMFEIKCNEIREYLGLFEFSCDLMNYLQKGQYLRGKK